MSGDRDFNKNLFLQGEKTLEIDHAHVTRYVQRKFQNAPSLRESLALMTDFTLIAEGDVKIPVNKAFLHSCPYFASMLENNWAERQLDSIHVPIPSLFLNAIVDFLYNGALM